MTVCNVKFIKFQIVLETLNRTSKVFFRVPDFLRALDLNIGNILEEDKLENLSNDDNMVYFLCDNLHTIYSQTRCDFFYLV